MVLKRFSVSQGIQTVVRSMRKRTYLVTGLALAAVPAGAAIALHQYNESIKNSHVTITTATNQQQPSQPNPGHAPEQPAPKNVEETSSSTSTTQVSVNGQNISVPENGTVNETIPSENGGSTKVDISSSNSGTTHNRSSTNISVHSTSTNNTKERSSTRISTHN